MLKRFILWDYPRGSRPYDVMVGVILAFIFLTPRAWFHDQPRIPRASRIAMLPSQSPQFWVDAALLEGVPERDRISKLTRDVQTSMGDQRLYVTRLEPIIDSDGELRGFIAFAQR